MAEEAIETTGKGQEGEQQFAIQRLYVKDLSVEAPSSPEIFQENWQPKIDMSLNTNSRKISDGVYEVSLQATVTAKLEEKVAFLVEVEQAGVFTMENFSKEHLNHMAGSYCPTLLFPYLREVISDVVVRAGFPQLVLSPVNFDALYAQAKQKQEEDAESATPHEA